jgi:GrpB-like predicted nucleotidyltransferase (UPF0157 family)
MKENPERTVLYDYDSAWPEQFNILADRARIVLGALVARVEHVGSTAVPGLAAKLQRGQLPSLLSDKTECLCLRA